jgi:peptidoglycan/LPS O-acetylase OafA/YrhL
LRAEIRSHTGLRGVAALLVVFYHLQFSHTYQLSIETATPFFRRCFLMVDLFFVLSGFIISYVYYNGRMLSPDERRSFWFARFARIYPLHIFALLLTTAIAFGTTALLIVAHHHAAVPGTFGDWLRQALLLNAWFPSTNEWNIPSWSISAEVVAYVVFPFAVALLAVGWGRLTIALAALTFYVLVGSSLNIAYGIAPLRCLSGFGLGMLVFAHRDNRLADWQLAGLQVASIAWICFCLAFTIRDPLIIPAFVLLVFSTWQDRGAVASVLSTKPVHWLGEISYSVYLLHAPIGFAFWFVWIRCPAVFSLPVGRVVSVAAYLSLVIAASHLSYLWIEKPCQRALKRLSRHLRQLEGIERGTVGGVEGPGPYAAEVQLARRSTV